MTTTATLSAGSARLVDLPFESDVFGFPVCRLDLADGSLPRARQIVELIEARRPRLVSCRIDAEANDLTDLLTDAGFKEVEQLATLECPIESRRKMPEDVTLGTADCAEDCAAIARQSFRYDRFHSDPNVPKERADEFKAAWARNNANGRADLTLLAIVDGAIFGFNQCLLRDDVAIIDLIAISWLVQRRGLGRALVQGALAAYQGKARRLRVGTQASNSASLGLYRSIGMEQVGLSRTFHRWQ